MATQADHEATPQPAPACILVMFGATGDLTQRKLMPALHHLDLAGLLPERFALLGMATSELDDKAFRKRLEDDAREHAEQLDGERWRRLVERCHYLPGDFGDKSAFERLATRLDELHQQYGTGGNSIFYLATPPRFFAPITEQLSARELVEERDDGWRRVVYEKPFGSDLDSARELNLELRRWLEEPQIYRIDHYLGKETVQNILVFRFANGIFEPVWNHHYVDHVQITVAESLGIEHRGRYYDRAGALRDMVPNHLFQLLALTAMEPPNSFEAEAVRDEKAKLLEAVAELDPEQVLGSSVRGQYGPGRLGDEELRGYREEEHVAESSPTETYVALKLLVENWRWAGVPFYLRTGKRLPARLTEVAIQFKRPPLTLFRDTPVESLAPNQLVLRIQPDEGISLSFGAKRPGTVTSIGTVDMDFCYDEHFGSTPSTGYETLLYDCMCGDATLFQRGDHVESSWKLVAPVQDLWSALTPRNFPNYAAGSSGPEKAVQLLERDGRHWREIG